MTVTLNDARSIWKGYLEKAQTLLGIHFAMLEFVRNNSAEQFFEDAKVLKEICKA